MQYHVMISRGMMYHSMAAVSRHKNIQISSHHSMYGVDLLFSIKQNENYYTHLHDHKHTGCIKFTDNKAVHKSYIVNKDV